MDKKLWDVKEVKEVLTVDETNNLLGQGWVLHSVNPNPNKFMFLLLRY